MADNDCQCYTCDLKGGECDIVAPVFPCKKYVGDQTVFGVTKSEFQQRCQMEDLQDALAEDAIPVRWLTDKLNNNPEYYPELSEDVVNAIKIVLSLWFSKTE